MFDIHTLEDLHLLRESHELECKLAQGQNGQSEVPKDFWPTYSAMANTHGGTSDCRNRTLHQMFLMINLGERAGSGLPKIRSGWEQQGHGLRLSDSVEPFDHTVLEMTWHIPTAVSPPEIEQGSPISSPISSPICSPATEDRILQLLAANPKYSTQQMGDTLGISKRAVLKQIEKLKQQGRLNRIGSAKGGHWEVVT
jgi:predicted HTH transcriptional regulator